MELEFDNNKYLETLKNRNLDFRDCIELFEGTYFTNVDDRRDYGEIRYISVGTIGEDVIVVVWTERNDRRRIISMRKASTDERGAYRNALDRPG